MKATFTTEEQADMDLLGYTHDDWCAQQMSHLHHQAQQRRDAKALAIWNALTEDERSSALQNISAETQVRVAAIESVDLTSLRAVRDLSKAERAE